MHLAAIQNRSHYYFHLIHNPRERKDKRGIVLTAAAVLSCFTVLIPATLAVVYGISSLIGRIKKRHTASEIAFTSLHSFRRDSTSTESEKPITSPNENLDSPLHGSRNRSSSKKSESSTEEQEVPNKESSVDKLDTPLRRSRSRSSTEEQEVPTKEPSIEKLDSSLDGSRSRSSSIESEESDFTDSEEIDSTDSEDSTIKETPRYDFDWMHPVIRDRLLQALKKPQELNKSIAIAAEYLEHYSPHELLGLPKIDAEAMRLYLMAYGPIPERIDTAFKYIGKLNQIPNDRFTYQWLDLPYFFNQYDLRHFEFVAELKREYAKILVREILSNPEKNPFTLPHRANFNLVVLRDSLEPELISLAFKDLHTCGVNIENLHDDLIQLTKRADIDPSVFLHAFLSSLQLPHYPRINEYRLALLSRTDDVLRLLNVSDEFIQAIAIPPLIKEGIAESS